MLWPETDQAKGNSLFHSTVYRLRSALLRDVVVHEGGVYRITPNCPYRYDVDEFRRLAKLGREDDEALASALVPPGADAAHTARAQAIALYRNPFLETHDYDWCDGIRRSLQEEMHRLLLAEARYLAAADSLDEAEQLYRRASRFDPYDERAHRGIMWCRAADDDQAGAARQFRECVRILQEGLEADPSFRTVEFCEIIRSGGSLPAPP